MFDSFYYESASGRKVVFGEETGIFPNDNDLRDYEWEYTESNGKIVSFERGIKEKSVETVFTLGTEKEVRTARNEAYEIFDADVISKTAGKLWINGYWMKCWIIASANTKYMLFGDFMKTTWKVLTEDPTWRKENTLRFTVEEIEENNPQDGLNYPYNYPYNYMAKNNAVKSMDNKSPFESHFEMVIYGPASNPVVTINDHQYGVTGEISNGERIVINSKEKTVVRIGPNVTTNAFSRRLKAKSVFDKMPAGISSLNWDGSFAWTLTLFDDRSEPPWAYKEDEIDEVVGYITSDGYQYITSDKYAYIAV